MADVIRIEVKVEGDEELKRAFDLMLSRVTDWRPFWPDFAAVFYVSEQARFASEGFGAWPPLSDGYRRWKEKHYPGQKILSLSGALRESLTSKSGASAVYEEAAMELTMGTTIHYAKYHQYGAPSRNLRPRPPIDITGNDMTVMATVAVNRFERYAQALGFETKEE